MGKKSKKGNQAKASKISQDKLDAKKAAVLRTEKKSRFPLIAVAVCIFFAAGAGMFLLKADDSPATLEVSQPDVSNNTSEILHPVAMFSDGRARHFEYKNADATIRYFILKSSDGIIRAAFDACDVCWPAGKGYYQDGDVMVCRNCGRRFASVMVNEVQGGCNPAPLKRSIRDQQLVLNVSDILTGQQYFNFKGRV